MTSHFILDIILSVGLIAFIIDGIKLLIESNSKIIKRKGYNNKDELTILLSAYNEENILKSIDTFKKHTSNLVIINDNSTDDTLSKILSIGEIISENICKNEIVYKLINGKHTYFIIHNLKNEGKVPSIHKGLEFVDTKYVFICDADIHLSNDFEMPITLLEEEDIDSVAFSVLPNTNKKLGVWSNILVALQSHEYHKSMNIGRQFANNTKSVECISGAAGLFKTERLLKLSKHHSTEFSGEDLERTLLELFDYGKTSFVDKVIYTDVPETFMALSKQRIFGWWPGLYRVFPLLFNISRKKGIQKRLKYETFYNMLSTVLDPIKVVMLWLLFLNANWSVLIALYIVYLIFEIYMYFRIKIRTEYKIKYSPLQIFLYPIYGIIQLHFRIFAMIRLFYMKIKKRVKPLKYKGLASILVLLLSSLSFSSNAEEIEEIKNDDKWSVTAQHSKYNLRGEWENNSLLYIGYDNWYIQYHHGLYNQFNVGVYYGNFLFDLGYRKNTVSAYTLYEHWLGNQTLRGQLRYNYNYSSIVDTDIYPNTPIIGLGFGTYHENTIFTVDILKELDRKYSWILTSRLNKNIYKNLSFQTSFSINDRRHYSTTNRLKYDMLYVFGTYHNNFDYTGLDYTEFGLGLQIKF